MSPMEPVDKPWYTQNYCVDRQAEEHGRQQCEFLPRSAGGIQNRKSVGRGHMSGGWSVVVPSESRSSGLMTSRAYNSYGAPDSLVLCRTRSIEELLEKYAPIPVLRKPGGTARRPRLSGKCNNSGSPKSDGRHSGMKTATHAQPMLGLTHPDITRSKSDNSLPISNAVNTYDVVDDVFSSDDCNVLKLDGLEHTMESSTDFDSEALDVSFYALPSAHTTTVPFTDGPRERPSRLSQSLSNSRSAFQAPKPTDEWTQTAQMGSLSKLRRATEDVDKNGLEAPHNGAFRSEVPGMSWPYSPPRQRSGHLQETSRKKYPVSVSPTRSRQTFYRSRSPARTTANIPTETCQPLSPDTPSKSATDSAQSWTQSQLKSATSAPSQPSSSQNLGNSMSPHKGQYFHKYSSADEFAHVHSRLTKNIQAASSKQPAGSLDTATARYKYLMGPDNSEEYISRDYLELSVSPNSSAPPPSPPRDIKVIKTNTPRSSPPVSPMNTPPLLFQELNSELSMSPNLLCPETGDRQKNSGSDSAIESGTSLSDEDHRTLGAKGDENSEILDGADSGSCVAVNADVPDPSPRESSTETKRTALQKSDTELEDATSNGAKHIRIDSQDSSISAKQQERPLSPRIPFSKVQTPSFTQINHPPPSVVISDHSNDDLPSPHSQDDTSATEPSMTFTAVDCAVGSGSLQTSSEKKPAAGLTTSASLGDLTSAKSDTNLDPGYFLVRPTSERRLSLSSTASDRSDSLKSCFSDSSYSIDEDDFEFYPSRRRLSAPVSVQALSFWRFATGVNSIHSFAALKKAPQSPM